MPPYQSWLVETQTVMPQTATPSDWGYLSEDYNRDGVVDIIGIKKNGTGTGTAEIHVLDGATNYQTWLLQTQTVMPQTATPSDWDYLSEDYNRDGVVDIIGIKKNGTGTGTAEIHVLDGATNYQTWLLQTQTVMPQTATPSDWGYLSEDYNRDGVVDIIGIKKNGTGTGTAEIHVLDGATNYQTWLLQTQTVMPQTATPSDWDYLSEDYNRDGVVDIIGIKKNGTGTGTAEIHVLDGATNYQTWLLQTQTVMPQTATPSDWDYLCEDYNRDGVADIVGIHKNGTDTGTTEVYVLNGINSYTLGSTSTLQNLILTDSSTLNTLTSHDATGSLLKGTSGNDTIKGGLSGDTLVGGTGDDVYIYGITDTIVDYLGVYIYGTADTIVEYRNGGIDTVESAVNYTLSDNLEDLTLTGNMGISGTGNSLSNQILGNAANNTLYGGGGDDSLDVDFDYLENVLDGGLDHSDTLFGGTGDDWYGVDSTTDNIVEYLDEGIDLVVSAVSYTLSDNLERLVLLPSLYGVASSITSGIGNALDNEIKGSSGDDFLYGGVGNDTLDGYSGNDVLDAGVGNDSLYGGFDKDTLYGGFGDDTLDAYYGDDVIDGGGGDDTLIGSFGNDTLTGGAGRDAFYYFFASEGVDSITDFVVAEDTITISDDPDYNTFSGLTPNAAITTAQFVRGTAAVDKSDRFIYNQNTGALFFDIDGTGATRQVQLATLSTGLAMTNINIFVI